MNVMRKLILSLLLLSLFVQPAHAMAPEAPQKPVEVSLTMTQLIHQSEVKYGLKHDILLRTLECESNLNSKAIGDHGHSIGIAQINLPSHPDITRSEALNPVWAVDWSGQQFASGNASQWTCYRLLAKASAPLVS